MPKLIRVTQKIFGLAGNASHFGQFGSKAAGSPVNTLDPASIQALSAFTTDGWLNAVVGANKQPFLEDMNGLFRVGFYQLAQIFQDGIPVWDPGTDYYTGSIVKKDGTFELYGSLVDDNIGNALPVQANNGQWQYLNPPSVPAGTVTDFAGPTPPLGWLLCDGSSYVVNIYQNLWNAIGYQYGSSGAGANFNVPDLRGLTSVGVGGSLGLTLSQTFGQITHTLTTAEMPQHNHPVTDPGHNHDPRTGNEFATNHPVFSLSFGAGANMGLDSAGTSSNFTGITIGNAGSGSAHNNVQPSMGLNKIIKY